MEKIKHFLNEQKIPYNDLSQYEIAFLHSSYTNETPEDDESNERIEFLGDSILGHIVAEYLYKNFPKYNQGDMTLIKHHFVNTEYLSNIGRKLQLEKLSKFGHGVDVNNLSNAIYEDIVESLIGVIYLDAGLKATENFIYKHILSKMKDVSIDDMKDSKTKLQELMATEKRGTVFYKTDNKFNEEDKMFTSRVYFDDVIIGLGKGLSKKDAEKAAANNALERMV